MFYSKITPLMKLLSRHRNTQLKRKQTTYYQLIQCSNVLSGNYFRCCELITDQPSQSKLIFQNHGYSYQTKFWTFFNLPCTLLLQENFLFSLIPNFLIKILFEPNSLIRSSGHFVREIFSPSKREKIFLADIRYYETVIKCM